MTLELLVLQPTTKRLVDAYCQYPKHALLLRGSVGSGLGTLASAIALQLVTHPTDISFVEPDKKGTITIEQVRGLYVSTRDKRTTHQVILIDDIDTMSREAQNAFLKLLEEPPTHAYFIVTTHAPEALLPTIVSRVQIIDVQPVSERASVELLDSLITPTTTTKQQILFLARGLPAELTRLASDSQYFDSQVSSVHAAQQLLAKPLHERLVLVSAYTDRAKAQQLVAVLAMLVEFMLRRTPNEEKLIAAARIIEMTTKRLEANGHVRTQLTNLVFQIA